MPPRLATLSLLLALPAALARSTVHDAPYSHAPGATDHDPVSAVSGLITRILGPAALPRFQLEAIPADASGLDVFETDAAGSLVVLRGNTGVSLSVALNTYLKYSLNASISWGRNLSGVLVRLPTALPLPTASRTVMPMKWRYAWNVCTFGYSFVWYSADQWQFMIDWLALQGVNLPLAFNGQEQVFAKVFQSLGLTDAEIWAYFSGAAFLPWNRMGNMQAFGALYAPGGMQGLDWAWMDAQADLQRTIVAAMRSYGMVPVLPGFAGHVPLGLERVFPAASFSHSPDWCGFNKTFGSVTLLEPTDPVFVTVGTAINKGILAAFGDPSGVEVPVFNADTFNEMEPSNGTDAYLSLANANVYASMTAADARSIYMMQGWLFLEDFWSVERARAYLSGVPIGGMLVLDLYSDGSPQWDRLDSYFGHAWIWNSLIVFGGRRGLYGTLESLASSPYDDRSKSGSLVGIGVTPEAIDMSQPMFDITFEAGWRETGPDPRAWLQSYAVRRYGGESAPMVAATDILYDSAYANNGIDTSIIEDVPGSGSGSRNTNATGFVAALRLFTTAFTSGGLDATSGPASYDITDLTRQVLCNLFQDVYGIFSTRVAQRAPLVELSAIADVMLGIISDVDTTDAADINFLLGTWLADSTSWAFNESQTINRMFNARNQITLWGPRGEINDYAAKIGWSGLVSDYYLPRWTSHTDYLLACVSNGTQPDWNAWGDSLLVWEQAWSVNMSLFPTAPSGVPPLTQATRMMDKYLTADVSASAYTFTANVDVNNHPAPPVWQAIPGSDNAVAISDDCPWLVKGDGSSIGACENSCNHAPGCNALNFNAGTGDCELRVCVDPLHPVLTGGYVGWGVWGNAAPGGGQDIASAWHTDVHVLGWLCDLSPACVGFTSHGRLVSNATTLVPSAGTNFYKKVGAAGGGPSTLVAEAGAATAETKKAQLTKRPLPSAPPSMKQRVAEAEARRTRLSSHLEASEE